MHPRSVFITFVAALVSCALVVVGCGQRVESTVGTPEPTPSASPSPSPEPSPEPTPDVGDGHHGSITVTGDVIINDCAGVTSASGNQVTVSASIADAGDRIVVLQMQSTFAIAGATAPVTDAKGVGAWEVARVEDALGTILTLEADLTTSFDTSSGASVQACLIPELTEVTVTGTGRILAEPWDGESGGVVAFYARDFVQVEGAIDASDVGFRGGQVGDNTLGGDFTSEDAATGTNAGGKGEGMDRMSYTRFARGAMGNAAGGGNNHNAGGGGGGNGGAGGFGGEQNPKTGNMGSETRGRGGGAVDLLGQEYPVLFGGGGGTGHQNDSHAGVGGAGGGIVVIIAKEMSGSGTIAADGGFGEDSLSNNGANPGVDTDGAGGGGAGGSIWLQIVAGGLQGEIRAVGGDGGNNYEQGTLHGTGGGGGGGRVYLSGFDDMPDVNIAGGSSGVNIYLNDNPHGATAGQAGVVAPAPDL